MATGEPTIHETASPDPADRAAVLAALLSYNRSAGAHDEAVPLALLLRDDAGAVEGGLWARSVFDWLFVELLVVPERLRGHGVGTRLMRRAEAVALERGCAGVWLDTFSFQARPFYERLGYTVFGTLEDHPRGGRRHFLARRLG